RPRRQAGPGGAGVHAAARGNPAEDPSDGPRRDFRRLRRAYGLFNWEAEFPEAFAGGRPGFDLIVANPPWERSRFEDPLFFSQFSPSYRALPESGKAGLRAGLLAREAVNSLRAEGAQRARTESRYFMRAYPKSRCGGDGNLCRFFAERDLSLLAPRGILSLAAPAALMMDDGSADLRRHVFGNFTLRRCEGFVNARGVFPDVHAGFKFALLQIENARDPAQAALARFRLTDPGDLATDDGAFAYPLKDVRLTSPGRLAYLEMADGGRELPALKRIFRALPPLGSGWLDFRRELDATEDKSVFREERGEGLIPLYKGEMLWQFDARYAEARQWVDPGELEKYLLRRNLRRLAEDLRVQALASPEAEGILRGACGDGNSGLTRRRILRYLADTAGGAFPVPDHSFARLCFRAIAADTNERSMVAALIPPEVAVQNSAWVSVPGRYSLDTRTGEIRHAAASLERLLFALGLFNSLPFDWLLRFSVNMNVNKTFVTRIPFPPASDREIRENPRYRSLARNAAVLTLSNTPDLFPEARALYGLSGRERALGEEEYGALKASGDVAAAEIYGLTAKDVEVMLKGFKVLAENRPGYVAEIRRQSRERLPAG
ncbi:MAG: hypothetical protein LBW85_05140, partial [Deltaproteobacteria bacterium]|nr:hypothetical protein [Deltaproteobacteria bacterium]